MSVNLKTYPELRTQFQQLYYGNTERYMTGVVDRFGAVMCLMLDEFHTAIGDALASYYIGTSEDDDQDARLADLGIERPDAYAATTIIRFSRPTPATQAYPIVLGTQVERADGTKYQTTQAATLAIGQTYVDVPARAVVAGAGANTGQNTITVPTAPIEGVTSVTNPSAVANGLDRMNNTDVPQYTADYLQSLARGTIEAIKTGARGVPGVKDAQVFEDKYARALVYVLIADAAGSADDTLLAAVRTELRNWRAAGCKIVVRGTAKTLVTVSIEYELTEGFVAADVESALIARAIAYVNAVPIGTGLYRDRLLSELNQILGTNWVRLRCPATDTQALFYQKLATDLDHVTATRVG